ncbi:hypothetical protein SO802_010952 [Lithocarpus litseifolius]|uniref:Defective in cullin neddylation protein n=1 Tax=Lithocarpus litseifolius TaxID=425828 RepID=A0AAW2DFM6_9ROSI
MFMTPKTLCSHLYYLLSPLLMVHIRILGVLADSDAADLDNTRTSPLLVPNDIEHLSLPSDSGVPMDVTNGSDFGLELDLTLVVSWHMKAATMCEFSNQKFLGGLQGLGIDSLEKFCEKIPFMCMELKDDQKFREIYNFAYGWAKEKAPVVTAYDLSKHMIIDIPAKFDEIKDEFVPTLDAYLMIDFGERYDIRVPGKKIPKWFNHQRKGSSILFWVDPEFPTFALFVVFLLVLLKDSYAIHDSYGSIRDDIIDLICDLRIFINSYKRPFIKPMFF